MRTTILSELPALVRPLARAVLNCTVSSHGSHQARDNSDDDGDDDDNSNLHRLCAQGKHLGKGAVAGIVVGSVLFLLLLLLLLFFLWRRRINQKRTLLGLATADQHEKTDEQSSTRLLANIPRSLQPGSPTASTRPTSSFVPSFYTHDPSGGHGAYDDRNGQSHNLSASTSSLPNPHDTVLPVIEQRNIAPQTSQTLLNARPESPSSDRDLPPIPTSSSSTSTRPLSTSTAPTSFSATLLSRGTTQASRLTSTTAATSSSMLHDEMAGYQKRLEAHHRKEMEGAASGIPADPPPVYAEDAEQGF